MDRRELDQLLEARGGLKWHRSRPCPEQLYDAGGAQLGQRLYVVCGYRSLDRSNRDILVFDMRTERWVRRIATPPELADSHCAVAGDGDRFLYFASGQLGPQCRPSVRDAFSYDTAEDRWHRLPAVPEPRYAATMQLWRGRLHFVGGADRDRWTPRAEHWSLGVADGIAREDRWRSDEPIPVPGMHRSSAVVDDCLYVFGGQQGDFQAIAGNPDCICTGNTREDYLACAFRLRDPSAAWERIADLPIAVSHCDFSTIVADRQVLVLGGQVYKHPEQFYQRLTDAIQAYDIREDRWTIVGHLPYRLKIPVVGRLGDRIFATTGQRGAKQGDAPGAITSDTWRTTVPAAVPGGSARRPSALSGKSILMISHDLSRTGSPLLLMETARAMIDGGATVRLASLADDADGWNLASEFRVPRVPVETLMPLSRTSDLILVNTTTERTKAWVTDCVGSDPALAARIAWWIHEIDVEIYRDGMDVLDKVALAIFDSAAARAAWSEVARFPRETRVIPPALSDAFLEAVARDRLPFPEDRRRPLPGKPPLRTRAEVRERLEVGPDDFLVCCIGTFAAIKGQRMLIRTVSQAAAVRGLPLKLLIVGLQTSGQRSELLADLDPDERRVLAPARAYVSQPDIAAFYRASDAFVMNTQGATGRGECFGRVSIEAMASGLPVLGTSAGGTGETIRDGVTGLLFPVGEAGQSVLADHLESLVRRPDLTRELARAGRARVLSDFRTHRFLSGIEAALALIGPSAVPDGPRQPT